MLSAYVTQCVHREMKQSKDPFEAAYVEQEEQPPESPVALDDYDTQASNAAAADDSQGAVVAQDDDDLGGGGHSDFVHPSDNPSTSRPMLGSVRSKAQNKDDEEGKITWMSRFRSLLLLLTLIKWQRCSE